MRLTTRNLYWEEIHQKHLKNYEGKDRNPSTILHFYFTIENNWYQLVADYRITSKQPEPRDATHQLNATMRINSMREEKIVIARHLSEPHHHQKALIHLRV
ncbi:hypothetical protein Trydic_g2538 [Trypoxylus dichotomus]